MTKKELLNNRKYMKECERYNLPGSDIKKFKNGYLLGTYEKNIYILLDKNYNTIGIRKIDGGGGNFHEVVQSELARYEEGMFPHLSYPFESLTLKEIIEVSSQIEEVDTYYDEELCYVKANDIWYPFSLQDDYLSVLLYIKYLGEKLKQYHVYAYQMHTLGINMLSESDYLNAIMNKVTKCLEEYHRQNPNSSNRLALNNHIDVSSSESAYLNSEVANALLKDLCAKKKGYSKLSSISKKLVKKFESPLDEKASIPLRGTYK